MQTLSERIRALMHKHQCSLSDVARVAGVKPPSVSNWLDGKTKSLKVEPALRLAKYFKLNMQWLTVGIGSMDVAIANEQQMTEHVAQNSEEHRLLEDFRNTPVFLRARLLSLLGSFASLGVSYQSGERFGQAASVAIGKSMSRLIEALISLRK
ncbi:MAG: helix-turn-helix domain-containing protein [Zoogloeaceae bacterium]|jgi:transcriptional regulator with XRE-family HTH domain|nr:helix-turn-helix domain-containing protein [Zoogloeaceae bacterium]